MIADSVLLWVFAKMESFRKCDGVGYECNCKKRGLSDRILGSFYNL